MIIGVDFDNTIVSYDELFHRLAVERSLVPASVAAKKDAVRDCLRWAGREDEWTALQGEVYGIRLVDASPFPGVLEFFHLCRSAGISVRIISHKTRFPFAGPQHDLHEAARTWLYQHGFLDPDGIGLTDAEIHLELTKADKIARIEKSRCDLFIDDLPEILADPNFPTNTEGILFDPTSTKNAPAGLLVCNSWLELRGLLIRRRAARHNALTLEGPPIPLSGGANNRVHAFLNADGAHVLVKEYFSHIGDTRDRFSAERAFYGYARDVAGAHCIPQPLGWDLEARWGYFEFVEGSRLPAAGADHSAVDAAMEFFTVINAARHRSEAAALPFAAEACFTVTEHLVSVSRRMDRLAALQGGDHIDGEARDFVHAELLPVWLFVRDEALRAAAAQGLGSCDTRCISPSDFGFHNALQRTDGTWAFFDFEYAGWDDPAKFVCDFFCQPAVPVPLEFLDEVVRRVVDALQLNSPQEFARRCQALLPVHRLKWCGIMLNEFVGTQQRRRLFSLGTQEMAHRKSVQLHKARAALSQAIPAPSF